MRSLSRSYRCVDALVVESNVTVFRCTSRQQPNHSTDFDVSAGSGRIDTCEMRCVCKAGGGCGFLVAGSD